MALGALQSALRHSRSTKFPSVQHDKLRPTSIFVRRPSCLELTVRTFVTNHCSVQFSFSSCGATMEAVAGMLLHSTALRPVSCTGPMRILGVCVCEMCVCVRVM